MQSINSIKLKDICSMTLEDADKISKSTGLIFIIRDGSLKGIGKQ